MKTMPRVSSLLVSLMGGILALGLSACTATKSETDELESQDVAVNTTNVRDVVNRCSLAKGRDADTTRVDCSLFVVTAKGERPVSKLSDDIVVSWLETPERISGAEITRADCRVRGGKLIQSCDITLDQPIATDVRFEATLTVPKLNNLVHKAPRVESLPYWLRVLGAAPQLPLVFRPGTGETAPKGLAALAADAPNPGFQLVARSLKAMTLQFNYANPSSMCVLRDKLFIAMSSSIFMVRLPQPLTAASLREATAEFFSGDPGAPDPQGVTENVKAIDVGNPTHIACVPGADPSQDVLYAASLMNFTGHGRTPRVVRFEGLTRARVFVGPPRNAQLDPKQFFGDGEFARVAAATADAKGNVFLLDTRYAAEEARPEGDRRPRIWKMTPDGQYTYRYAEYGQLTLSQMNALSECSGKAVPRCTDSHGGITVDKSGNVFAAVSVLKSVHQIVAFRTPLPFAGNGTGDDLPISQTLPAGSSPLGFVGGLLGAPHGSLLVASPLQRRIYAVAGGADNRTVTPFLGGSKPIPQNGLLVGGSARIADIGAPTAMAVVAPGVLLVGSAPYSLFLVTHNGDTVTQVETVLSRAAGFYTDNQAVASPDAPDPALFHNLTDMALDNEGRLLVAETPLHRVLRLEPGPYGKPVVRVVGGPSVFDAKVPYVVDGRRATGGRLALPSSVLPLSDGGYLVTEHPVLNDPGQEGARLRRVGADGIIETLAGVGVPGEQGDGGNARAAHLDHPGALAHAGPDSFYFADNVYDGRRPDSRGKLRRLRPDGAGGYLIDTIAGGGDVVTRSDEYHYHIRYPRRRNAFFHQTYSRENAREAVPKDLAALGAPLTWIEDIAVAPDGSIFISAPYLFESTNGAILLMKNGRLKVIAGGADDIDFTFQGPALRHRLVPKNLRLDGRGHLYFVDDNRRILELFPKDGTYHIRVVVDQSLTSHGQCAAGVVGGQAANNEEFLAGMSSICIGFTDAIEIADSCGLAGGVHRLIFSQALDRTVGFSVIVDSVRGCF